MKISIAIICTIVYIIPAFCTGNHPDTSYADFLFFKKEYQRAVTEYYREIFSSGENSELSRHSYLQIVKCYYLGKQYDECTRLANDMIRCESYNDYYDELNRYSGLSYLQMGYPSVSLLNFDNISNQKASLYKCISYLYLSEANKASQILVQTPVLADSQLNLARMKLSSAVLECRDLRLKIPLLAGGLSALLPGSGYLYCGYYQTAFSSLIFNALLLGTANELLSKNFKFTGGTMTLISFGWYVGNIYGSYTSAIKANDRRRKVILDKYRGELEFLFQ